MDSKEVFINKKLGQLFGFFYAEEAGKKVIQIKRITLVLIPLFIFFFVILALFPSHENSFIRQSRRERKGRSSLSPPKVNSEDSTQKPSTQSL